MTLEDIRGDLNMLLNDMRATAADDAVKSPGERLAWIDAADRTRAILHDLDRLLSIGGLVERITPENRHPEQ